MFKKLRLYGFVFSCLILANIFLAYKLYRSYEKNRNINRILAEISQTKELASQFNFSSSMKAPGTATEITTGDSRAANLKIFFRKYNSDLYDQADHIVQVSDKYNFDYRLLPAIAMQESNLCKYIPENSYNCWGWGIYGDTVTRFDSYEEAINIVSGGIKKHYIDKGLVTASMIMAKYTPSSNGSWAHGVNTFLKVLE